MKKRSLLLLGGLLLFVCQNNNKKEFTEIRTTDSLLVEPLQDTARFKLSSFNGFDSVANSDFYFMGSDIDSISIKKMRFEAIYLNCFKALLQNENYKFLKTHNAVEYKTIMAIHTRHMLLVNGTEYSFNGKGSMGCWRNIPESTSVSVNSKVYSLFSNRKHLGKLVILESIKKVK